MAQITGTNADDTLVGGEAPDVIFALAGNDILIGGAGADYSDGGTGDDWHFVDSAFDVVVEAAGEGNDRVFASASFALGANSDVETLSTDFHDGTTAIDLTGSNSANLVVGNNAANLIDGRGGNDVLFGRAGNDILTGGTGADYSDGGTGDDWHFVDNTLDRVAEAAGEGNDRVFASASFALGADSEVETLSTDFHDGTAAIDLSGSNSANLIVGNNAVNVIDGYGGNDVIFGRAGNDILTGGAGADYSDGGTGDDWHFVDNILDRVAEAAGEGNDRVFASASFALGADSEVETLSTDFHDGTAAIDLSGSNSANLIVGNNAVNVIDGYGGNDVIFGRAGNDILTGGAGADYSDGGTGDDWHFVDNTLDRVAEAAGEGNDRVFASASFALGADSEVETLSTDFHDGTAAIDLSGSNSANLIFGNNGANVIDGYGGNDVILGRAGNDILIGGAGADYSDGGTGDDWHFVDSAFDVVVEATGEGNDRVFASASFALGADVGVETLSTDFHDGIAAIDLSGSNSANLIIGNNGANLIDGRGGNDVLQGRGGADSFAFTTALNGIDTILDFNVADDTIRLGGEAGQPFALLGSGALATTSFLIGTAAQTAGQILLYDALTGALFYDADGNGAGAAVQFATLSTGLALTAADFVVSGPANQAPAIGSAGTASVAENSPVGTVVYQVVATDADGDRLTYTLAGTDAGLLTIDASGAVRLLAPADFETRTTYNFTVVASDSGLSTSRAVTLTVTDLNDTVATPVISEIAGSNESTAQAQSIDRAALLVASNPNLADDDLPSATIQGSISIELDKDFFSITLQAGERLILDIDGTTGGLDPHIRVYGPNTVELGDNDDLVGFDPGSVPTIAQHNTDSFFSFRASSAGTYYFSVEAFSALSLGTYKLHVTIGPPATAAQLLEEDIDALVSGAQWPSNAITYSFPDSATDYPPGFGDPEEPEVPSFAPFTAAQQAVVHSLLQHIATTTTLTFQYLTGASDRDALLRFAMTDGTGAAHAYYPGNAPEAGSAWFNKTNFNAPQKGNYAWMGILHEAGHALGLKHGHEPPALSPDRDSVEFSVMTYRSYPGDPITNGYSNETWGYPQTLMMLDIAALQRIYGANYNFNSGDSVYSWNTATGEMSINGTGQGAPGGNRVFLTIWDGGGQDTYDLSAFSGGVTIDLRPGEWTTTSIVQLAGLGDGRFARGNVANALLFEGNAVSAIENAIGGAGNDILFANQVANRLTGNGGVDTFRWMAGPDSGTGAAADTIADFLRGVDRIDLSGVDANAAVAGDQAFAFIGTSAFHNVAGELRYQVEGANLRLQGDLNGDGVSDFEIVIQDNIIFAPSDFSFL